MAASHLRSISLPSRSDPLAVCIENQFHKLKVSQSSPIGQKLSGLKNLFECVYDLLQLPHAQQTVSNERKSQCVENFFSQLKECVKELESSLRRRKSGESGLKSDIDAYMMSRKKLNKVICKCLRNLKRRERNCMDDNSNMISMLGSVEKISLIMFESILSFISQPKKNSKPFGLPIISRLLQSRRVLSDVEVEVNEVEKIDAALAILKSGKDVNLVKLQNVIKGLEALESSIQEAEEELECIYRQLVKTRVSILNILNY